MTLLFVTTAISDDHDSVITSTVNSCSMISDCTLKTKIRRKIENRIYDNGASFQECHENCRAAIGGRRGKRQTRTKTKIITSGTRLSRTKSTGAKTEGITVTNAGNCDCYCSKLHDPCLTPTTGDHLSHVTINYRHKLTVLLFLYRTTNN